jgi:hypothetical protein
MMTSDRPRRGMPLADPRGRKLRDGPGGLWWYLAGQVPPRKSARHETHFGLLLAAVAAGPQAVPGPFGYFTQMLYEAGWASSDGTRPTGGRPAPPSAPGPHKPTPAVGFSRLPVYIAQHRSAIIGTSLC